MADRVLDNGLILTDFADQMARFEDRQYQQYARQREAQDYERKLASENAANAARRQAASGDMRGAQATAAAGDAWDVWGTIDAQQKAQVAKQAEVIGTAAYNLRRLPRGQARLDYFRAFAPTLLANGMTQEELAQYANSGVLDNDELLGGYADRAVGIQNLWKADQDKIEREYKRETDLMQPITAADGAVLTRSADGSLSPVYTPGTKPLQEIIRNEDGSSSLVNVPGTPGTSYTHGQPQQAMAGALSGLGLPAPVVAGFMGNFEAEGGYSGKTGDGGSAAGVAQWRDERRANFVRMFGRDPAGAPIEQQAQFVAWEMNNPGRAGMTVAQRDAILAARTPAEAADLIDRHYERSSGAHRDRRIAAANAFAGQGSAPAQSNGIQVTNLGGGRSGPEWRDETRTINGQQITGQVSTKTGQFRPYGGAGRPAKGVSDPVAAANAASTARQTVQQLLTHPGLGWSVGAYSLAPTIPGTRQADFKSMVETLKSQVFLGQIGQMKGLGALTDAEGARLTASIASLDPSQSEEQFKRSLETIGGYFALAERRARAASSGGQAAPAQAGRQAPAGATKTATGPNGQKMALVGGKWVAY